MSPDEVTAKAKELGITVETLQQTLADIKEGLACMQARRAAAEKSTDTTDTKLNAPAKLQE